MKLLLAVLTLLFAVHANAQKDWVKESSLTYSIKHPDTWKARPTENPYETNLAGPTPDFEKGSDHLGTTLYISVEDSKYSSIDSVAIAYKEKLMDSDFLTNVNIHKEEKITFKGVDAEEITFSAKVQQFSTACKIILFQKNDLYYELSVSYDAALSKKLLKEAYKVMETFAFID